jgi:hypothetical protein
LKVCYKCQKEQPLNEFKFYLNDSRVHSYCKTCRNIQASLFKKRYRDDGRQIDYEYKRTYGITLDDYKSLCEKQGFRCKICKRKTELFVDHNHKTDEVRGLLCRKCNLGIGYLEDNIDSLISAIKYLQGEN